MPGMRHGLRDPAGGLLMDPIAVLAEPVIVSVMDGNGAFTTRRLATSRRVAVLTTGLSSRRTRVPADRPAGQPPTIRSLG